MVLSVALDPEWLDRLPNVAEPEPDLIAVNGIAVGARPGRLRLLLSNVCVDLAVGDVVHVHGAESDSAFGAMEVEVLVREGAKVLAVQDADALFLGDAFGLETFPYRTRKHSHSAVGSQRFYELERDYLRRWNLAV